MEKVLRKLVETLSIRLGGILDGNNLELENDGNSVYGRCGWPAIGFDVEIDFFEGQAVGRLGGGIVGMDVKGSVTDVEPIIAGALFAITYYLYKVNHRSSGSSGGSGGNQ